MSGKGSGRRGRGGRGGAKRSRDDFERKTQSTSESAEPAAPLPGGFKSMKAKWISFYENEKKAQESEPSTRPQSAADTVENKQTAAEPLASKPLSSAPNSVTEEWRVQHPPEAVKVPNKEAIGSSGKHQSRHAESEAEQQAQGTAQPDESSLPRVDAPDTKAQEQSTAALPSSAAPAPPESLNSTAEGAVQASGKAGEGSGARTEGAAVKPPTAHSLAGSSGPGLHLEPARAEPAEDIAASGPGPGRVAAMQDAAATYKAASKAHSSMREALSPKRAEATGRLPAPKPAVADLNTATNVEAITAASEPSAPSRDAAAPPQNLTQEQPVAGQRPDQTAKGPHSIAELGGSRVPALRGSAFQHATAGQLKDNEQGGSSTLDKVLQPKPEIKEEATQPVDSSTAKGPVAKEHRKAGATDKAVGKSGSEAGIRQPKQKGPKGVTDRQQGRATGTKHSAGPALKQPAQNGPGPDGKRAGQPGTSEQKIGQQASLETQLDPASRREPEKALAQAKTAADGRVAKAQEDIRAEDRIEGWKAQLQETQNAADDAPVPAQPAPGPAQGGTEEASRQKGSDASSLERSPEIPHPEPQQQRADTAEAQGGHEEHALANTEAVLANSQPSQLAPVEYLGEGSSGSQQLGQIDLNQFDSYRALWDSLREDYGQSLPEGLHLRLVYEDGEGDFVMLQPDEPWPAFLSSARRVIISCH